MFHTVRWTAEDEKMENREETQQEKCSAVKKRQIKCEEEIQSDREVQQRQEGRRRSWKESEFYIGKPKSVVWFGGFPNVVDFLSNTLAPEVTTGKGTKIKEEQRRDRGQEGEGEKLIWIDIEALNLCFLSASTLSSIQLNSQGHMGTEITKENLP